MNSVISSLSMLWYRVFFISSYVEYCRTIKFLSLSIGVISTTVSVLWHMFWNSFASCCSSTADANSEQNHVTKFRQDHGLNSGCSQSISSLLPLIPGSLPQKPYIEPLLRNLGAKVRHLGTLHACFPPPRCNGVFHPKERWCSTSPDILESEGTSSVLSGSHLSSIGPTVLLHHLNDPFLGRLEHHRGHIKDTSRNLRCDELT